jgi:hypothetical protein
MASGATVKPSLMFFKKFTTEEVAQFERAKAKAYELVIPKYAEQITKLKAFIEDKKNPPPGPLVLYPCASGCPKLKILFKPICGNTIENLFAEEILVLLLLFYCKNLLVQNEFDDIVVHHGLR